MHNFSHHYVSTRSKDKLNFPNCTLTPYFIFGKIYVYASVMQRRGTNIKNYLQDKDVWNIHNSIQKILKRYYNVISRLYSPKG